MKDPIFKTNPKLENYFKTADGNAFFTEHDAKNHAGSLKAKKVEKVECPFVKEKVKETPVDTEGAKKDKKNEVKNKNNTPKKKDKSEGTRKDEFVKESTNVDNASYAELMLFVTDNEIQLSSKKSDDVKIAIKAYLANPNKEIVHFKGDLN